MSEKKTVEWQGENIKIVKIVYGRCWKGRGTWEYVPVEHEVRYIDFESYFHPENGTDANYKNQVIRDNFTKISHEGKLPKKELKEWIADLEEFDKRFPELWEKFVDEENERTEKAEQKRKKQEAKERAEWRLEKASKALLSASQMALEYIMDGEIDEKVVIKRLRAAIKKAGKQ